MNNLDWRDYYIKLYDFLKKETLILEIFFISFKESQDDSINEKIYTPIFTKIELDSEIKKEAISSFKNQLTFIKNNTHKYIFEQYDPVVSNPNKKFMKIPLENEVFSEILVDSIEEVESLDSNLINETKGICFRLKDSEKSLFIFREINKSHFLDKKFSLVMKNKTLKKSKRTIFKIDYKMDFYWFEGTMNLKSYNFFNKLFNFNKTYKDNAESLIENIEKNKYGFSIENIENFKKDSLSNLSMIKRLHDINTKSFLNDSSFKDIISEIKENFLDLKYDEEKKILFYEKYNQIWLILNLFGDNILESKRTKKKYISHSKTEL